MPKKTFTPEQIVGKLWQIEMLVNQGKTVPLAGSRDRRADLLPVAKRVRRTAVGARQEAQGTAEGERAVAACRSRFDGGKADPEGHRAAKLLSPERRRIAVRHAQDKGRSERQACRLVGQPRGTRRYQPTQGNDEDRVTQAIITLACQYGGFGYRRITVLLQKAGWNVGKTRSNASGGGKD